MRRLTDFFRRTRIRLTLWYVFLLALVLVLFSVVLYVSLAQRLTSEIDTTLKNTVDQVIANVDWQGDHLIIQGPRGIPNHLSGIAGQSVVLKLSDLSGKMLRARGPYVMVFRQVPFSKRGFNTVDVGGEEWRVFSSRITITEGAPDVYLQIARPLSTVESTLNTLLILETIIGLAVLMVAVVLAYFLASRALRPVDEMTRLAGNMDAVTLHERLNLGLPDDELGRLARTLDGMLGRLDEAFESQKRFVSDAAHELRTPLTVIKGITEVALTKERSAASYQAVLQELQLETDHLAGIADDLLALSRADSDCAVLDRQELDLNDAAMNALDIVLPMAQENGVTMEFRSSGKLRFYGDQGKLTRMFLNLLDNAVRYSQSGQAVAFSLSVEGPSIVATIKDYGLGIEAEELDRIFDRFHRLENAREKNPAGSGLGLPIARWIARAHGGEICARSRSGEGTTFEVVLPG
jgi:heavy metal sensor kinase